MPGPGSEHHSEKSFSDHEISIKHGVEIVKDFFTGHHHHHHHEDNKSISSSHHSGEHHHTPFEGVKSFFGGKHHHDSETKTPPTTPGKSTFGNGTKPITPPGTPPVPSLPGLVAPVNKPTEATPALKPVEPVPTPVVPPAAPIPVVEPAPVEPAPAEPAPPTESEPVEPKAPETVSAGEPKIDDALSTVAAGTAAAAVIPPVVEESKAKTGPVLTAPYHLYCWGTPDSVTKQTSYTVTRLPSRLLAKDCTFAVSARTMQDGPRCVLSVESPAHPDSLLWIGTEHTNLVHAFWPDGSKKFHQTEIRDTRVGYSVPWTRLAIVWCVSTKTVSVYADGKEVAAHAISEEGLKVGAETEFLSLVLGRGKEGSRRAWGWDGELCDALVWDRALEADEVKAIPEPEAVHPDYKSAWNDGWA